MRGRVACAALFLACVTGPSASADGTPTAAAAAAAFDEICVRQAPGFRRSPGLMARHGVTRRTGPGTADHPSGALTVALAWGAGDSPHECRVSYAVPDAETAAEAVERIARRLFEDAWGRRQVQNAGRTGTAWTVSIQGTLGEMVHMPYSGPGREGVMLIRF